MSGNTVTLHRVIKATPERVYRAFLEPEALVKWWFLTQHHPQRHAKHQAGADAI